MAKFRKKPVVIEAVQWTGTNVDEVLGFCFGGASLWGRGGDTRTRELLIETREDGSEHQVEHIASVGDWIIKGVKGEFYPCKPDIFAATYDPMTQPEPPAGEQRVEKVAREIVSAWLKSSGATANSDWLYQHEEDGLVALIAARLQAVEEERELHRADAQRLTAEVADLRNKYGSALERLRPFNPHVD